MCIVMDWEQRWMACRYARCELTSAGAGGQAQRDRIAAVAELGGGQCKQNDFYPRWAPNPDSRVVKLAREVFTELLPEKPQLLVRGGALVAWGNSAILMCSGAWRELSRAPAPLQRQLACCNAGCVCSHTAHALSARSRSGATWQS